MCRDRGVKARGQSEGRRWSMEIKPGSPGTRPLPAPRNHQGARCAGRKFHPSLKSQTLGWAGGDHGVHVEGLPFPQGEAGLRG